MIELLIFFTGIFLGLTIFAIFGANKDLVATEIDRDFYKRLYKDQRKSLHDTKEKCKYWEIEAKKWASELGEQKLERGN
ncbi:MAG TPA: hypothetical protein GX707_12020 [Epulopiscium sp.]|nr:hypothetical protein [Candidatus Epulonipiscium sp.]